MTEPECCITGKDSCPAVSPPLRKYDPGYACTRPKGHDGNHIACIPSRHRIHEWDRVEAPEGMTEAEAEIIKWAQFFATRIAHWDGKKFADFMTLYGDYHSSVYIGKENIHKEIEKTMMEFLAPEAADNSQER